VDAVALQCPKCNHSMERLSQPEADVHRCTHCSGLWFDLRGHELLKDRAEAIDTGAAATGEQYNAIDHINCPVCRAQWRLVRMVDPQQPHIWFESCMNCYGRFYDAGEFRDFAEYGWQDFVKDLDAPERV